MDVSDMEYLIMRIFCSFDLLREYILSPRQENVQKFPWCFHFLNFSVHLLTYIICSVAETKPLSRMFGNSATAANLFTHKYIMFELMLTFKFMHEISYLYLVEEESPYCPPTALLKQQKRKLPRQGPISLKSVNTYDDKRDFKLKIPNA